MRLSNLRQQWKQRRQAWRLRLGHNRATFALLVLLTLGVGEPLLAVVHCELWLPFAYRSYFAAQHGHQQHGHHRAAPGAPGATPGTQPSSATPLHPPICHMHSANSEDVPFHIPPSPIHDMLPVPALLLSAAIGSRFFSHALPQAPPRRTHAPLLRPPILAA